VVINSTVASSLQLGRGQLQAEASAPPLRSRWGLCSFMGMMGCFMETGIVAYNLPREFFVLQINGRVNSTYRRYQDALRAGLLLKHQFPHGDIKVCEVLCEINSNEKVTQQTMQH
jgi:hypothetical protein